MEMSLSPFINEVWGVANLVRPRRLADQHFALGFGPNDMLAATYVPRVLEDYYRPWINRSASIKDLGSSIKVDDTKFQVVLDVQHFSPEDISVKTADGYIVVEGKHEEKKDEHGFISRQFVRRYALPEGTQPETVESKLSADGILTVTAPRKVPDSIKGERKVPITQTGPLRPSKQIKHLSEGTHENSK